MMHFDFVNWLFLLFWISYIIINSWYGEWIKPLKERSLLSIAFGGVTFGLLCWLTLADFLWVVTPAKVTSHRFYIKEDYKGHLHQFVKLDSGEEINITQENKFIVPDNKMVDVYNSSGYYAGIYMPCVTIEVKK